MGVDRLDVYLGGRELGTLTRASDGALSLTYDDGYRSSLDATPLSCSMPLAASRHATKAVAPFLWGLLPENERVLSRWAREFQISATNPLALLSAVGSDLPGGLQMYEPGATPSRPTDDVEWLTETDVARLLEEVRRDQSAWIAPGAKGRWSLAGAQAKIALLEVDGKWGRPSGSLPTNRILKPAPAEFADHDVNEYLCLNAAHRLGLTVAASRVLNFGSERCVVVSRYDRVVNTHGGLDRIHQEDLCQAMSVMPEQKYEADGGPGARSIAQLLRQQLGEESGELAVRQFFDALIVQWLLAAPDAHAKNYSLLHLGRSVRLAPIYDVSSALAYRDFYEPKIKLAMKIGGHYRVGAISRTSWAREAALAKLDAEMVVARARDLARQLPDAFADSTRAYRGDSSSTAFANILSARVIDRSNRCAALLGA